VNYYLLSISFAKVCTITKALYLPAVVLHVFHLVLWLLPTKDDPATSHSHNDFSLFSTQPAASPGGSYVSSLELTAQISLDVSWWWELQHIRSDGERKIAFFLETLQGPNSSTKKQTRDFSMTLVKFHEPNTTW